MRKYVIFGSAMFIVEACGAASFDCTQSSTSVEKLICGNRELSELDDQLSAEYQKHIKWAADLDQRVAGNKQKNRHTQEAGTRNQQREWLHFERNTCPSVECLKATYQSRLSELGFRHTGNVDWARFDLLSAGLKAPDHVFGYYTQTSDLTSVNADGTGFEKTGEHEDYVKIIESEDGRINIELWLTFGNSHICTLEGEGVWKENHMELLKKSDLSEQPCRLRIYSDGEEVLLRDPGGVCTRMSCGARGWLDRSRL